MEGTKYNRIIFMKHWDKTYCFTSVITNKEDGEIPLLTFQHEIYNFTTILCLRTQQKGPTRDKWEGKMLAISHNCTSVQAH